MGVGAGRGCGNRLDVIDRDLLLEGGIGQEMVMRGHRVERTGKLGIDFGLSEGRVIGEGRAGEGGVSFEWGGGGVCDWGGDRLGVGSGLVGFVDRFRLGGRGRLGVDGGWRCHFLSGIDGRCRLGGQ